MITKIPRKHANARRLFEYLQGHDEPERRLLDTTLRGETPRELAEDLADFSRLFRPRLERYVKHIILSFAPGEELSDDELRKVLAHYLEKMGYGNAPFAAYLHTDTSHPHLHIVTTPTSFDGSKVNESWDWPRSERVAREIEKLWHLREVALSKTAQFHAAKSPEHHVEKRGAEASQRKAFQKEIAQVARRARTLPELLEGLATRDFEVRVMIDSGGRVRGFSFGRDGTRFKGSQLGRAFKGEGLLTSFGVDFDPRRDAPLLRNLSERYPGRITAMAITDGQAAAAPVEPAPSALPGPFAIPPGRYDIAAVDARKVGPFLERLERQDLVEPRFGWEHETIARSRGWIDSFNGSRVFLLRTPPREERVLGFRDLSSDHVRALERAGYEPAWTVRVGERYDVLLRAHERLGPSEVTALRNLLIKNFELPVQTGVFMDAVRLPGAAVQLPGGRREVAELVGLREEPFSASERFVEAIRDAPERAAVMELASRLPQQLSVEVEPPLVLPRDSPVAGLQEQVEAARRLGLSVDATAWSEHDQAQLVEHARAAQREVLAPLGQNPTAAVSEHPGVSQLLEIETELARRVRIAEIQLYRTEDWAGERLQQLEPLARQVEQTPTLDGIHRYQVAVQAHGEAVEEYQRTVRAHAGLLQDQALLDRERLAAAVSAQPVDRDLIERYQAGLGREIELGRRAGREAVLSPSREELAAIVRRLEAVEGSIRQLQGGLRAGRAEALPAWEAASRERLTLRDAAELARARAAPGPERLRESLAAANGHQQTLSAWSHHQSALVGRSAIESRFQVDLADPSERLRAAADRVRQGDFSPEALRRLNAELVRSLPAEAIPTPAALKADLTDAKALVERYLALREDIVPLATRAAQGGDMDPAGRVALLARSSEAVGLHQHIEQLQRKMLGVIEPGGPPAGISASAWNLAWLHRAVEKGLLPEVAQAQLANTARVASAVPAAGRALWLAYTAARTVTQTLTNPIRRALTQ